MKQTIYSARHTPRYMYLDLFDYYVQSKGIKARKQQYIKAVLREHRPQNGYIRHTERRKKWGMF